ncbi:MAG: hypothetical protein AAF212_11705, partial [Verrucomicrobiota bacterium]
MEMKSLTLLASIALGSVTLSGQGFDEAAESIRADLDKALAEYAALQSSIGEEKVPLANELNELEAKVTTKRREVSGAQRRADNAGSTVSEL